jgi:hypothetical protein
MTTYTYTTIGSPDSNYSLATAINASGQIAGYPTMTDQPPLIDPVQSQLTGVISESRLLAGNTLLHITTGVIPFSDPDAADRPTASIINQTLVYHDANVKLLGSWHESEEILGERFLRDGDMNCGERRKVPDIQGMGLFVPEGSLANAAKGWGFMVFVQRCNLFLQEQVIPVTRTFATNCYIVENRKALLLAFFQAILAASPAFAQTLEQRKLIEECGNEYKQLKAAGTNVNWLQYWPECRRNYLSQEGASSASAATPNSQKPIFIQQPSITGELYKLPSFWGCTTSDASFLAHKPFQSGYSAMVEIPRWRDLVNLSFREQVANGVLKDMTNECLRQNNRATLAQILFTHNGNIILKAWTSAEDHQWNFLEDLVSAKIAEEDQQQAQRQAAETQRQAAAEAQKKAAAELERRKLAALADCGTSPKLSDGPWFSSTYKVAAQDAARKAVSGGDFGPSFLCVKSVEYISPAPNPYGGNAARIKVTGYDPIKFELKAEVGDIAY